MQYKPKKWLLYAIFPLSVGLLWLDGQLTLQPQEHQWLEMGIVLLSFGCMTLWVRANRAAVAKEPATGVIYRILPDPKCSQSLDLHIVTDWHDSLPADIPKSMFVDLKGKYN